MADPSLTDAEALAMIRTAVTSHPCPWCGKTAWNAGVTTLLPIGGDIGTPEAMQITLRRAGDGAPGRVRAAALFDCSACFHTVMFRLPGTAFVAG